MSRVLIYEGANGHGECLPSYYAYFKELGYDVDFILREGVAKENPLWMIDKTDTNIYVVKNPISPIYSADTPQFREIMIQVPDITKYDLYFIGTINPETYLFVKFLSNKGIGKDKILHQNHLNYKKYLLESRQDVSLGQNGFTLGMTDHDYLPQLAPSRNISDLTHDKLDCDIKDKDTLNIFISGLSHIHFKNFELLVKAAEELNRTGKKIKIQLTGIREQGTYTLPNSDVLEYLGRINFKKMAECYCSNDFLFVLFDTFALQDQNKHNTFLDGRVSGSRNMSIIYKIPLVVQKSFQKAWGLNNTNSISYEGHEYKKVLLDLYNIKQEQYNNVIKALKKEEKEEFELGLTNLKTKIEALKTNVYDNRINVNGINARVIKKKKNDFIHF